MFLAQLVALLSLTACSAQPRRAAAVSFDSSGAASEAPIGLEQKSRVYVPYGLGVGMAFGMGAAEQIAYDSEQKYVYAISEQGAVNVIDFDDAGSPLVKSSFFVDLAGATGTDIEVCPTQGWLIIAVAADDKVSNGKVMIYETVKRSNPASPKKLKEMTVGPLPDMVAANHDCSKIAVANEGEGDIIDGSLVDPEGSVSIISNLNDATPTVQRVSLAALGTDDELIAQGVHLPLSRKAMEYWDEHSDVAADLNFTAARASYTSAMNFEPEYLAWSADGSKLYVNLQENSAMVVVDVPTSGAPTASRIDAFGLKDWTSSGNTDGIDVKKDNACDVTHQPGLYSMRNADAIQVVTVDGVDYILTANEGDDKEYGDYTEKWKAKDLLDSLTGSAKAAGMTVASQVVTDYLAQNADGADSKRRFTVGSSAVDYSNPAAPNVTKLVMFGGRGISIFKETGSALDLLWDSGSEIEKAGCKAYPWAHNGIQDEEFAPLNGALYNSANSDLQEVIQELNDPDVDGCLDQGDGTPGACPLGETTDQRSPKDGPGCESVVAGTACGRLVMVTAGEKNSILYVYDISNIASPSMLFVSHLSPASETKSPGVAYAEGTLGEIDPESMVFLDDDHSPTGKAGVLIAGAWSGTISWWEFSCPSSWPPSGSTSSLSASSGSTSSFSAALCLVAALLYNFVGF